MVSTTASVESHRLPVARLDIAYSDAKLDDGHSTEVQTHAGHSIAFNMFLHFVTL